MSKTSFAFPQTFKVIVILVFLISFNSVCSSQDLGVIKGRILDSLTHKPVPFASVILATTMIGDIGKEDGTFTLRGIPGGKYDILVSSVGYRSLKVSIMIKSGEQVLVLQLAQQEKLLKEVVISSKSAAYRRQVRYFRQFFIGETENAKRCTILNLDDVNFEFYENEKLLTASSEKPIEVINEALGYRILYWLDEFRVDFDKQYSSYLGTPWFTELQPKDERQKQRWRKARELAYHGSVNELMRSLKSGTTANNGYLIFKLDRLRLGINGNPPTSTKFEYSTDKQAYDYYETTRAEVLDSIKPFNTSLKIVYLRESPDFNAVPVVGSRMPRQQVTIIKFLKPGIVIHQNGYFEHPENYFFTGYMAWSQNVAEILPMEYQPEIRKKK